MPRSDGRSLPPDRVIFWIATALLGFGAVMVFSASAHLAAENYRGPWFFFLKQFLFFCVGFGVLLGASHVPYAFWKRTYRYWLLGAVLLLIAVLFMSEVRGARRWLFVGPLSLQVSEVYRFAMVLFMAATLARQPRKEFCVKHRIYPQLAVLGAGCLLVMLQPDFGAVVLLVATAIAMLFVAGVPFRHLFGLTVPAVGMGLLLVFGFGYKRERFVDFVAGLQDPFATAYQVKQGVIHMGAGGITGRGLGGGMAKFLYLPDAHTDFILASVGEELGLLATLSILTAYGVLIFRGLRIAAHAPDRFAALLVSGLVLTLGLQAAINLGVVLALLPPTGLPLPLLSYGGSSVLFTTLALAVILSVSRHVKG